MLNFKLICLEERIVLDAAIGAVIYVDVHATGHNNGTSWSNAYTNLQDALTAAAHTSTPDQIFIADGVYKPGASRTDTFIIPDKTTLVGGFGGQTILSGEIGTSAATDNTLTVVTVGTNVTASLSKLTITGGYNDAGGMGGGLSALNAQSLTLSKTTFSNNFATLFGGGLYAEGLNSLAIQDSQFSNNSISNLHSLLLSSNLGGGIYTQNNASVLIDHNVFTDNSANGGGAIGGGGGSNPSNAAPPDLQVTITNNTFQNNSGYFSGAYAGFYEGNVNIEKNSFVGNTAERAAPAIAERGVATITIKNNLFDHNSVSVNSHQALTSIGAVVIESSQQAIVENNTFTNNTVTTTLYAEGGALTFQDINDTTTSNYIVKNNLFVNNSALTTNTDPWAAVGGAVSDAFVSGTVTYDGNIFRNNQSTYGGAVYSAFDNVSFTKNTFIGNQAAFGGAIDSDVVSSVTYTQNTFIKNHASNSGGAIHTEGATSVVVNKNIFTQNKADIHGGAIADGADPLLTDGPSASFSINSNVFSNNQASDHTTLWFNGGETTINAIPIANSAAIIDALIHGNNNLDSDEILIA